MMPTVEQENAMPSQIETPLAIVRQFMKAMERSRYGCHVGLPSTGVVEVHGGRKTIRRDYFDAVTILPQWIAR